MADQHGEIDHRDRSTGGEMSRSLSRMVMIGEIADEKGGGRKDCANHAGNMLLPKIAPNKIPPGRDKRRAYEIENRVYHWQLSDAHLGS